LFQSASPIATTPTPLSLPLNLNFASSPSQATTAELLLSPIGPLSPIISPRQNSSDPSLLFPLSPCSQSAAISASPSVLELLNSPRTSQAQSLSPSSIALEPMLAMPAANLSSPRNTTGTEVQLFWLQLTYYLRYNQYQYQYQ
jgi:hypothetical protein